MREQFQLLCAQAITSAELPAFSSPQPSAAAALPAKGRWSRRAALGVAGAGIAAAVGTVLVGRRWWEEPESRVRLTAALGTVRMRAADGHSLPAYGDVPSGAMVSTEGVGSAVTLSYADGSTVSLIGDSSITVATGGREIHLHQGTAGVNLQSRDNWSDRITFVTDLVRLAKLSGARLTLGQGARMAEVEVQYGTVAVSAPTGEPMAVVREGELLTVTPEGDRHHRRTPSAPEEFAWDFRTPAGWVVGRHAVEAAGPVVRPVAWPDPYYDHAVMYQIRSENPWTRGYFRLVEGSTIHVRYRANQACPRGQVCFCVRTPQSRCPDTGMVEYNGGFETVAPGGWKWLRVRAGDMLDNKHTPRFGSPWIAFLVIFNTFEEDIGLEIAELRVTPPGKGIA